MSRRHILTVIAVVAAAVAMNALAPDGSLSAQGGRTIFRIRNVSTNATADGVVLKRAINAPVTAVDGRTVGTAFVTSFEAHPGLEFLPTLFEIQSGSGTAIIAGLASRDGRFRQTIGFDTFDGSPKFALANFVPGASDYVISYDRLPPASTPFSTTLNHAFEFTQNRVDRQIGDTGLTFRPGNRWSLVAGFGQLTPVGDNPSMSFTNLTTPPRFGNVNFLRLPGGHSGAVIACFGSPAVCGVKAIGDYDGIYGTALSLTPASLGVNASAASATNLTYRDPSTPPNPPGCPSGQPLPPPKNVLFGTPGQVETSMAWDSVECAIGYVLRITAPTGVIGQTDILDKPSFPIFGRGENRTFAVASVGPDGVVGPFSQEYAVQPLIQ